MIEDCRYEDPSAPESSAGMRGQMFPVDGLFRPLLADMKAPRFSGSFRDVDLQAGLAGDGDETEFRAGLVGFGETFGIWSLRKPGTCNGLQVGIFGAVFSQFNFDTLSVNLINSDFQVGLPVTVRWEWFTARLQLYHQSSHIGDEFLLFNQSFPRVDLVYETLELLLSAQEAWWRVYAGGGYLVSTFPEMAKWRLQGGAEVRGPTWRWPSASTTDQWTTVAGADIQSFQLRDWGMTVSAKGGIELIGARRLHRVRILAAVSSGYTSYGQFFNSHRWTSWGLEGQFEF
ncbi:MAG: DUF1207 domain-containing protein [Bradymonadaceae bacterium]